MEGTRTDAVVNEAPAGLQSRIPTKPAGANSSPYIPTKEKATQSGGYFYSILMEGTRTDAVVNEAPAGLQSLPMGFARPH